MIPSARVFCDTTFFFAVLAPKDAHYARAGKLLADCRAQKVRLCATWEIVSETATLLRYRLDPRGAIAFLDTVKPELDLVPTPLPVLQEAERVFRRHAPRRRLSFCDAISFVVVTTLLDNAPCLSFDRDFQALGLTVIQ